LRKGFGGQFVQVFVATAFYDFDFIHFAALGVYAKPKKTFTFGPVQYEAGRILCASKPRRCACVDDKPACSAIKLITATFSQ
jgi:hypothetical protein